MTRINKAEAGTKKKPESIPVKFGWLKTAEAEPSFYRHEHQGVYITSDTLLLWPKKKEAKAIPGYANKFNMDFEDNKAGQVNYHALNGEPIETEWFCELKGIPAPEHN